MTSLADFTISKFKGELNMYIPSILYYLYAEDIITEEFYIKWAIKLSLPNYLNRFHSDETERKFLEAADDFTNWIE
jgi:hypothetical protein